jgi:3-dehydroquinate dehydratase type I
MLCISIDEKGKKQIMHLIKNAEMAEIRLEKEKLSIDDIIEIFGSHNNLIATCRPCAELSDSKRKEILTTAIDAGAKWIDIEIESNKKYTEYLTKYAKTHNCKVIISYHNYKITPDNIEIKKIIDICKSMGADLVKIATFVNKQQDVARILGLYAENNNILVLGMGNLGKITRIAALKLGAPFTFVSINQDRETAPGQLSENEMKKILTVI